jgi:hypothetical protein
LIFYPPAHPFYFILFFVSSFLSILEYKYIKSFFIFLYAPELRTSSFFLLFLLFSSSSSVADRLAPCCLAASCSAEET